jgi:hypothetical protein
MAPAAMVLATPLMEAFHGQQGSIYRSQKQWLTWIVDVQVLGSKGGDGGCPGHRGFQGLEKLHVCGSVFLIQQVVKSEVRSVAASEQ